MTRLEYNILRGWQLPEDEDRDDEGYLVEYLDGGKPNHPDFKGYISWSPKERFENVYREEVGMTFGMAIEALKKNLKVARGDWFSGTYLRYVNATYPVEGSEMAGLEVLPWIVMKTVDDQLTPWAGTCFDLLAEDWMTVE